MKLKLEIDFDQTTMRTGPEVLTSIAQSLSLPFNRGAFFPGQKGTLRDEDGGIAGTWVVE